MLTNYLVRAVGLIGLSLGLLTNCQATHSALPAGGGFGTDAAATVTARPVPEEPEALVASVSAQPLLPTASRPQRAQDSAVEMATDAPHYFPRSVRGVQAQALDTLPIKQPATRREFGVTQMAHIGGGLLIVGGGASVINGLNSDSSGYYPLAAIGFGIVLAIIGGVMLLFKGKTARRRQR